MNITGMDRTTPILKTHVAVSIVMLYMDWIVRKISAFMTQTLL